jgi:4a-hydroxytetrahydrobiopterin dehydratase
MPELYDAKEIKAALKEIPEWHLDGNPSSGRSSSNDFSEAINLVIGVAELAEEMELHPDIDIRYTKVRLALPTHRKGGLTGNYYQAGITIRPSLSFGHGGTQRDKHVRKERRETLGKAMYGRDGGRQETTPVAKFAQMGAA